MGNPIELVSQCDLQMGTRLVSDCVTSASSEVKTIQDDVLLYVQVGAITIQSADETLTVQTGEASFIRRGEYLFEYTSNECSGGLRLCLCFLMSTFLSRLFSDMQKH